jgi:hypothetical protein
MRFWLFASLQVYVANIVDLAWTKVPFRLPGCLLDRALLICRSFRPFASLQVHVANIVDLAWTPDGYTLIACSMDDTISVIRCECGSGVRGQLQLLHCQHQAAAAHALHRFAIRPLQSAKAAGLAVAMRGMLRLLDGYYNCAPSAIAAFSLLLLWLRNWLQVLRG